MWSIRDLGFEFRVWLRVQGSGYRFLGHGLPMNDTMQDPGFFAMECRSQGYTDFLWA